MNQTINNNIGSVYLMNYAGDFEFEDLYDMTVIKPKDFSPIKANFTINSNIKINRECKNEIMRVLRTFYNPSMLYRIIIDNYIKSCKVSDNTMIFSSTNIIFTIVNIKNTTGLEILIMDKDENLILNIQSHDSYINKDYDLIYETSREILNLL